MIATWIVVTAGLAYFGFLFAVAYFGDRQAARNVGAIQSRPTIYALSLGVFCTSWTFFGSVGLSATTGLDFIPIYFGSILMFAFGLPLLRRVVRLSKAQNITSIADFLAARYGKSQALSVAVTAVAIVGLVPYIALQLQAVSTSVTRLLGPINVPPDMVNVFGPAPFDTGLIIALVMALFAILFGTRHIDVTEHQHGLILAIATESIVKLGAFLIVGSYVVFGMFDGPADLLGRAVARPEIDALFSRGVNVSAWLTTIFLGFVCTLVLPRQFHVTVVENNHDRELKRAAWLFPLYLIAINIFVVPVAVAGLLTFPPGAVKSDMFMLALPMSAGADLITLTAFIGGLSAATAMVIVSSVALGIMVSNGLALPMLLRRSASGDFDDENMGGRVLAIRRIAILTILTLAYLFHHAIGDRFALASIGLVALAAMAQFAPAFFGGLFWRRATASGAIAGLTVGIAVWAYTLLLPWIVNSGWAGSGVLEQGPFGLTILRPENLLGLGFEPIVNGVFWSVVANLVTYVGISLLGELTPIERLQANAFVERESLPSPARPRRIWRSSVLAGELLRSAARYLGQERAERAFAAHAAARAETWNPEAEADVDLVRFTERLLASAIGAASARLVLSLLLGRHRTGMKAALDMLDDASEAINYNRDVMQLALDQVRQGISVFDADMRLVCWNRQFRELLSLPAELVHVGTPLDAIIRFAAERGDFGDGEVDDAVADRIMMLRRVRETFQERISGGRVIEVRTNAMPQGGFVASYGDITDRVEAAEALGRLNETLEGRVRGRTAELMRVNAELVEAKAKAEDANRDKTRFLAAASHDILQPLNAARLYTTSLVESRKDPEQARILKNIDVSLESVEEIFGTLLDISRLDTGALVPQVTVFSIDEVLRQLAIEFEQQAHDKGLTLRIMRSSRFVRSDRQLLRRVLQNLVSNAIKYTRSGRVLVGCRQRKGGLRIEVHDTGPGIPADSTAIIFKEFQRLPGSSAAHGIGLGLSIVERICRALDYRITVVSDPGRGSMFAVTLSDFQAACAVAEEKPPARRLGDLSSFRVLCIDNDARALDAMEALLIGWDCETVKASGLAKAIRAASAMEGPPNIIVADYHLDDGTGIAAVKAVRESIDADVPAVILSADRSPAVESDVRDAGLYLLRKPLKPAALRSIMAQTRRPTDVAAE